MAMTARMRRIASDWEQVRKDFAGHNYIMVAPVGPEPPEKYHVTYFVNGIYLLPDGKIQTLCRHEVEITLHSEYPRYKPICRILTPIWHPNFRDGQICIGDIWGAGESLTDIIINIGDMIQYKSWNSFSPLSADAAKWAIENKSLFPVGNVNLQIADYASAKDSVDIDLFDEDLQQDPQFAEQEMQQNQGFSEQMNEVPYAPAQEQMNDVSYQTVPEQMPSMQAGPQNDFEITAEELAGIEYVPSSARMQSLNTVRGKKVNFKTILVKGILWGLLGAILGFLLGEALEKPTSNAKVAKLLGYPILAEAYEYDEKADEAYDKAIKEFKAYCKENGLDEDDDDAMYEWLDVASDEAQEEIDRYLEYRDKASESRMESAEDEFDIDLYDLYDASDSKVDRVLKPYRDTQNRITRISTGLWSAIVAMMIGLALGIGEGVYYGSASKALIYGAIGAGISLALGFISGDVAQLIYAKALEANEHAGDIALALYRGLGWSIMGLGIGAAIGLIRPSGKRILFCTIGGAVGAFLGGFIFNQVCDWIPNDVVARGIGLCLTGLLIGLGVGLLEQFAKQAWLKVIRGEFEGKEYLVFAGTTSIGNTGKNAIVLFKDKLVAPHHCDIVQEGGRYSIVDAGSPMGTVVNGTKILRHTLRQGDNIAIGNSVLVFNMK